MQTVRRLASGLAYAIVSLLLVLGSLSLSLAQAGGTSRPALPATVAPSSTATAAPTSASTSAVLPSATGSATSTITATAPASIDFFPTLAASLTATSKPASTLAPRCGAPAGWIRGYVVQPGDTLFRIATLHDLTVDSLKQANCKTGTVIYAGELLWVPFMLPPATELTIIPTFPTPTEPATSTATATSTVNPDP